MFCKASPCAKFVLQAQEVLFVLAKFLVSVLGDDGLGMRLGLCLYLNSTHAMTVLLQLFLSVWVMISGTGISA